MTSLLRWGKWLKKSKLTYILISLCILLALTPQIYQVAADARVPVSISSTHSNYAMLPASTKATDDLWGHARQSDGKNTTLVSAETVVNLVNTDILVLFSIQLSTALVACNLLKRGLRQGCQLLDIPPPSC
jgi:hypothetical protein